MRDAEPVHPPLPTETEEERKRDHYLARRAARAEIARGRALEGVVAGVDIPTRGDEFVVDWAR